VATVDETRERLRAEGRPWFECRGCGRPLDRHSRRKHPDAGIHEYLCAHTARGVFEPRTFPELDYTPTRGLHA
jgi:hypothetical protein